MLHKITKILAICLCFLLVFEQSGFAQVAGELDISGYLLQLRSSLTQDKFRPLHLRYLSYDSLNNNFKLLLDKGDFEKMQGLSPKGTVPEQNLKETTKVLLNYFFIGITLPNSSFWVNLRPDSENEIIDSELAKTDVGRILLEADLQLKKDTAKFTSPETPEGRQYWDKLYQKAGELFGSESVTIPTLTRPWIVPDEIIIRETPENAYIYKATLKVMLEQDYLKDSAVYNFKDERLKALNEYSSQLIREKILPKLTKEINIAKRYSALRQIYYSLILAQWFKQRFYGKGGLYSWLIDKKNLNGLTSKQAWSKTTYFKAYQTSFQQGEYNLKEPTYTPFGQTIRSYMSGGIAISGDVIGEAIKAGGKIAGSPLRTIVTLNPKGIIIELRGGTIQDPYSGEVNINLRDISKAESSLTKKPTSSPIQENPYYTSHGKPPKDILLKIANNKSFDFDLKANLLKSFKLVTDKSGDIRLDQNNIGSIREKELLTALSLLEKSPPGVPNILGEIKEGTVISQEDLEKAYWAVIAPYAEAMSLYAKSSAGRIKQGEEVDLRARQKALEGIMEKAVEDIASHLSALHSESEDAVLEKKNELIRRIKDGSGQQNFAYAMAMWNGQEMLDNGNGEFENVFFPRDMALLFVTEKTLGRLNGKERQPKLFYISGSNKTFSEYYSWMGGTIRSIGDSGALDFGEFLFKLEKAIRDKMEVDEGFKAKIEEIKNELEKMGVEKLTKVRFVDSGFKTFPLMFAAIARMYFGTEVQALVQASSVKRNILPQLDIGRWVKKFKNWLGNNLHIKYYAEPSIAYSENTSFLVHPFYADPEGVMRMRGPEYQLEAYWLQLSFVLGAIKYYDLIHEIVEVLEEQKIPPNLAKDTLGSLLNTSKIWSIPSSQNEIPSSVFLKVPPVDLSKYIADKYQTYEIKLPDSLRDKIKNILSVPYAFDTSTAQFSYFKNTPLPPPEVKSDVFKSLKDALIVSTIVTSSLLFPFDMFQQKYTTINPVKVFNRERKKIKDAYKSIKADIDSLVNRTVVLKTAIRDASKILGISQEELIKILKSEGALSKADIVIIELSSLGSSNLKPSDETQTASSAIEQGDDLKFYSTGIRRMRDALLGRERDLNKLISLIDDFSLSLKPLEDKKDINAGSIDGTEHKKYRDEKGQVWLFKAFPEYRAHRAFVDEFVYYLALQLRLDDAVEVKMGKISGRFGTFVRWIDNKGSLWIKMGSDPKKNIIDYFRREEAKDTLKRILREQVLDWLVSQHDSHAGSFLIVENGRSVVPIDKSQSFKYMGFRGEYTERLATDYNPNKYINGEKNIHYIPIYNIVLDAISRGEIPYFTLQDAWEEIQSVLKAAENINNDKYIEALRPYAIFRFDVQERSPQEIKYSSVKNSEEFLKLARERKESLRSDFYDFYKRLGLKKTASDSQSVNHEIAQPPTGSSPITQKEKSASSAVEKAETVIGQGRKIIEFPLSNKDKIPVPVIGFEEALESSYTGIILERPPTLEQIKWLRNLQYEVALTKPKTQPKTGNYVWFLDMGKKGSIGSSAGMHLALMGNVAVVIHNHPVEEYAMPSPQDVETMVLNADNIIIGKSGITKVKQRPGDYEEIETLMPQLQSRLQKAYEEGWKTSATEFIDQNKELFERLRAAGLEIEFKSWNTVTKDDFGIAPSPVELEGKIINLASNIDTYNNPDNKELYKLIVDFLQISKGVAIDIGSGSNNLSAEGLIEAGLNKVVRIDNSDQLGKEGMVNTNIEKKRGDATQIPFSDKSFDAAIFNQSLSFIGEYSKFSALGKELLLTNPNLSSEEIENLVVRGALKEAFRVLKPGGWLLIKPGSHLLGESRWREGPELEEIIRQLGFENVKILTVRGTRFGTMGEISEEEKEKMARVLSWSPEHKKYMFEPIDIPVFIYARRSAASPVMEEPIPDKQGKGGVDFRALPAVRQPMNMHTIQGQSPKNNHPLDLSGTVPVSGEQSLNLDEEWQQVENMIQAGIIPSSQRIKEYLQACCQNGNFSQEVDKVLSGIVDILRLEEEKVFSTEPALKELLVLLESDKSAQELQVALSQITVLPKEPKLTLP